MTREEVLKDIKERFKGDIVGVFEKTSTRVYIEIKPESLPRIAEYVFKDIGARFNIASGVDTRFTTEILYHFIVEEVNLQLSFRVILPREKASIESITPIMDAANWIEREMTEVLGIEFRGHPDMRPLLLPDDWPKGVYPLRREYEEWDKDAVRDRGV